MKYLGLIKYSLLAVLNAFAFGAAAEVWTCNVELPSHQSPRYPTELRVEIDATQTYALVTDNAAARPNSRPVRGEIVRDDSKRLSVTWEVNGLKPSIKRAPGNGGIHRPRARYRASIKRANGALVLTVQTVHFEPPQRTVGLCKASQG